VKFTRCLAIKKYTTFPPIKAAAEGKFEED